MPELGLPMPHFHLDLHILVCVFFFFFICDHIYNILALFSAQNEQSLLSDKLFKILFHCHSSVGGLCMRVQYLNNISKRYCSLHLWLCDSVLPSADTCPYLIPQKPNQRAKSARNTFLLLCRVSFWSLMLSVGLRDKEGGHKGECRTWSTNIFVF